ncbi:hypothetical protein T02_9307 [Trichinella nativa]|uniref:Uncharacterized protein n=1 Tax=Trichinella nativa TaxID=6335 RepID=A0A0V1LBJ8_9BILA|nr:hypothetical protein T02_9307 [Trichinella nativa]
MVTDCYAIVGEALLDIRLNENRKLHDLHDKLVGQVRSFEGIENEYASDFILTVSKQLQPETWENKVLEEKDEKSLVETFFEFLHRSAEIEEQCKI